MANFLSLSHDLTRRSACALGLVALALGCEPVPGADGSITDGTLGEAGGDGGRDASLDVPDSGGLDAQRPDALVGSTRPDGSATLDASSFDAMPPDAAPIDAMPPDAMPPDAAPIDAMPPDAASTSDAAQASHTHSGAMTWVLSDTAGTEYCPSRTVTLWKEDVFTLSDPGSPGLRCGLCPPAPAGNTFPVSFLFSNDDFEINLSFDAPVRRGFSVQSFHDNLTRADVAWKSPIKAPSSYGAAHLWSTAAADTRVEFLSYQAPMLHLRVVAHTNPIDSTVFMFPTPPYLCFHQAPTGPVPDLCTEVACEYRAAGEDQHVGVTLDLLLPIEQAEL